jgi:nucleotide-binding universal stress UspA family protein
VKHLLVTTDFSALADQAIEPAADLARRLGAKLTLAHTITSDRPPEPDPDAPFFNVAQRLYQADQELEGQVKASLTERAQKLKDLDVGVAVARGDAVEGIVALARDLGADLIVISSQGRTGLARMLLGSVAEEMARNSPIPVLIWKGPAPA